MGTKTRMRIKRIDRVCPTGKVCYEDRDTALTAAERQMDLGLVKPGCHLTPYRCVQCGAWHYGNQIVVFREENEP